MLTASLPPARPSCTAPGALPTSSSFSSPSQNFFGGDCSLRVCPMGAAFVDVPRGDLNHDGMIGYGMNPTTSYSQIQWSRYKQYESWPVVDKSNSADFSRNTADGIDVTSANSNVVGGWAAQVGEAHFQMECSGKGMCDRALGICNCYDGYTGGACQRSECAFREGSRCQSELRTRTCSLSLSLLRARALASHL